MISCSVFPCVNTFWLLQGSLWAAGKPEDLSMGNAWSRRRDCTCHSPAILLVLSPQKGRGRKKTQKNSKDVLAFVSDCRISFIKKTFQFHHGKHQTADGKWFEQKQVSASQVRKEFSDRYRGSCLETLQNLTHWILCVLFMAETVAAAGYITKIRSAAYNDPESSTFGIPNDTVVLCAKYAITLNIKLVDSIWTPLSTWLSKKENWRTETDLKAEMVVKLFAVKFVVFYYPFAYTIFIQPHTAQGCDGGHMSGTMLSYMVSAFPGKAKKKQRVPLMIISYTVISQCRLILFIIAFLLHMQILSDLSISGFD